MHEEGVPRRRRRSEVYRNIDDPLKVMGLLSLKSCSLLLGLYAASYFLDLLTGLWHLVFGAASFLIEIAIFALAALALCYAEKQDDEHLVPAMLRYTFSRRWRVLYSAVQADGWPPSDIEWVFQSRQKWLHQRAAAATSVIA